MTSDRRTTPDCRLQLLQEMRCQNYDMIRFASYRTACKLRYVQKKVYCKLYYLLLLQSIFIIIKFSAILLVKSLERNEMTSFKFSNYCIYVKYTYRTYFIVCLSR